MKKYCFVGLFVIALLSACSPDTVIDLGSGFTYWDEGSHAASINYNMPAREIDIPCHVIDYDYNEDFIVAYQDNSYAAKCIPNNYGNRYCLWIIDKKKLKRYGPLEINEYKHLADSLRLPGDLRLNIEL